VVEADVPKVTIITRKAYGGGYAVMGSKQLSADLNFAWPTARIAVIGAEGAAQLLVKRFPDPTAPEVRKIRQDFIDGYNKNLATPWIAAERGYIDGVIEPHQTRLLLRQSLKLLRDKQNLGKVQRKHGLTPI
jgi:acetyl-CoA carboxylase carboxyltransferase component